MSKEAQQKKFFESVPEKFVALSVVVGVLRWAGAFGAGIIILLDINSSSPSVAGFLVPIFSFISLYIFTRVIDLLVDMERNQRATNELLYRAFSRRDQPSKPT